jgi:hypothetical protein
MLVIAGCGVAILGLGVASYLWALSRGHDLDHAEAVGVRLGLEQGMEQGRSAGRTQGFAAGFDQGFPLGYADGYEAGFLNQFRLADLEPPERVAVPDEGL